MSVHIQTIPIRPKLKDFIDAILLVNGNINCIGSGLDVIEPDGSVKLVIPLDNDIRSCHKATTYIAESNRITLVGMFESSFRIESLSSHPSKILIVQLNALGAYRLANLDHKETLNTFQRASEVFGGAVSSIEDRMANETAANRKVVIFQNYLQNVLESAQTDSIFEHCAKKILKTGGATTVKELEEDSGYSARWLNMKFTQRIGLSPKSFASLIRFKQVFKQIATQPSSYLKDRIYLDYYYDQAHFLKEFKKYSGKTPRDYYFQKSFPAL